MLLGLNLAKGNFPAKQGRSRAEGVRKSARRATRNSQHSVPGSRKVPRNSLLQRFERTGGANRSEQVGQSRQNA